TMGQQPLPHSDASQTVSLDTSGLAAVLTIVGQVQATKPPFNGANSTDTAHATDQGDVVITLPQSETILGTLSSKSGTSGDATVSMTLSTLDDSQQPIALSLSDVGTTSQSALLAAGQYELDWSTTAQVGGISLPNQESRTFTIQLVPEPTSVVALAAAP